VKDESELHPNAELIHHELRERPLEPAGGDAALIEAIGRHIERHLGPVEQILHEDISHLVHLDLHWVQSRPDRPFHTLVTSGMSERPMRVPEGAEGFQYAELVLHLPSDWPMTHESWTDERHYWPIRLLKSLARMPHEYETWLCEDHTVGTPGAEPYGPGTLQCGALIAPYISAPPEFNTLDLGSRRVNFFSVIPLYKEEMDFKKREGADALYDAFEHAGLTDVVSPERPSAIASKR
jgi:Suppressor of fused protein (SUFU)